MLSQLKITKIKVVVCYISVVFLRHSVHITIHTTSSPWTVMLSWLLHV